MDNGSVGIVILAAGQSERMGTPKQLLDYRGTTLLRHAAETALEVGDSPIVVVLGAYADRMQAQLADLPVSIALNPNWQDGMGGSLRAGLRALIAARPDTGAALFMLCDQPHVSPALLRRIIKVWRGGGRMAACRYEHRLGVPAIFDAALFPELLALEGAAGARQILAKYAAEAHAIRFPEGALDIDTPDDYARLLDLSVSPALPIE